MTRKKALTDLLEWVIEGAARPYVIEEAAAELWDFKVFPLVAKSYEGSLDAAKALHEAVLPGWTWNASNSGTYVATTQNVFGEWLEPCSNPARAWLIAIIKALIAMEDT